MDRKQRRSLPGVSIPFYFARARHRSVLYQGALSWCASPGHSTALCSAESCHCSVLNQTTSLQCGSACMLHPLTLLVCRPSSCSSSCTHTGPFPLWSRSSAADGAHVKRPRLLTRTPAAAAAAARGTRAGCAARGSGHKRPSGRHGEQTVFAQLQRMTAPLVRRCARDVCKRGTPKCVW